MKLVIFDFDGVIADSEKEKFEILQNILKENNLIIQEDEFSSFIGKKRGFFIRERFPDLSKEKINELMFQIHKEDEFLKFELMPNLKELLEYLSENNFILTIATGSDKKTVNKVLEKNNIKNYFSEIITGDEVSESKPNPKIFNEILRKYPNIESFIIEDSPVGIEAGNKTSAKVISLGRNNSFSNHFEILKFFKNNK